MSEKAMADVVDLTLSDSSDDLPTLEALAARTSAQKADLLQDGGNWLPGRNPDVTLEVQLPARTAAAPPAKVNTRGPSPVSLGTTAVSANGSRRRTPALRLDATPSKSGQPSTPSEVEIRDSQSPSPLVQLPPQAPQPQPEVQSPQQHSQIIQQTPKPASMTPKRSEWTVDKIADALSSLAEQVGHDHARLVDFELEEAEKMAPEPRDISTFDDFAEMKPIALEPGVRPPPGMVTMAIKFKQHSGEHSKSKVAGKRFEFPITAIKTNKESVPRYRFHHVEIRKNILAPNSMLNFVPHLRDVDPNSADEKKYAAWLAELERLDSLSGFNPLSRREKVARRAENEYAATLSMYLDSWLCKLAIDGCTKSNLIRLMASEPDTVTPQQKNDLLGTYSDNHSSSPRSLEVAQRFTEAFDLVFDDENNERRITLSDVLKLDKNVEPILDNKRAKDTPSAQRHQNKELMQKVVESLGSYSTLGCLICFSHDCEHGEMDWENQKRCFSLEEVGGVAPTLKAKWAAQIKSQELGTKQKSFMANQTTHHQPCRNQCYRTYDIGNAIQNVEPWTKGEVATLEHIFATIGYSPSLKPQCFVAAVLGRPCRDVDHQFKKLGLTLPPIEAREPIKPPKQVPWYDRKKKQLLGDWQDQTVSHEHAMREILPPCNHEGPCTSQNGCPCAGTSRDSFTVLCERFCQCTAEECAIKFTGCACHSSGKTCLQRQKEGRACICIQLNRECDPVLCRGCGAKERADPENAYNAKLHSTGCQNVPLQRGAGKAVVIGQSRLEGCGYGLFTAEDIAADEFIIEYTGELISHDEGVRRENRRGDVFDEENKISYLFTLLEQEGIWVDAAIYGNLSRYINHSQEYPNITPKIVYVNHEFRIKFSALRDIKAGTELFFNYGDNFPNLTKKLVESREKDNSDSNEKASSRQKRTGGNTRGTARKTTSKNTNARRASDEEVLLDYDGENVDEYGRPIKRLKTTRGGRRVGAGRKPKTQASDDAVSNGSQQHNAEISDSQAESLETPTRRRVERKSYISLLKPGSLEASTTPDGVKKVSRRGGARPGAGRKPKHRPACLQSRLKNSSNNGNPSNNSNSGSITDSPNSTPNKSVNPEAITTNTTGAEGEDSDDVALASRRSVAKNGAGPSSLSNETAAAGRKRKASELDEADEGQSSSSVAAIANGGGASVGPYRQDVFLPITDDDDDVSIKGGGGADEDEDDGDGDAPTGRRQTQKPMRYRNPAE
ncbi:hypothetical protein QBC43DRAFT_333241 [Cladorrhinum sp. PSN259]|nr:hypothetical protein QBC43DRAFT_333241 [Cladorrhinum sp. PSN259]